MLTQTNPPLPPYPWLVGSEPALSHRWQASRKTRPSRSTRQLRFGIEAGFVVLCGLTSLLLLWPSAQPVTAVDVADPARNAPTAVAPAPGDTGASDSAEPIVTPPAITREAALPATMPKAVSKPPVAAPLIGSPSAVEQVIGAEIAPVAAPRAPSVAETMASAATIAQVRSVVEDSRDTARLVIRLASRQRPPRQASAEELTRYRLRQQNADAARGYRRYLDTLGRSMRGSPSPEVSRQLLERAQQTQAYLATMLEESQASLR